MNNSRPRLLFVHQANGMGGAAKSLALLLESMDTNRYDILLFLPGDDDATAAYFDNRGFPVLRGKGLVVFGSANGVTLGFNWRKPWTIFSFWKRFFKSKDSFEDLLRQIQPDLVYLNTLVLTPYGWAAKRLGVPVLWHIREEVKTGFFNIWAVLTKWMVRRCATRIISISQTNARKLVAPQAIVVYNYLPEATITAALAQRNLRSKWGIGEHDVLLCMVGGTIRSKGLPLLLCAMQLALSKAPQLRLLVAGKPPGDQKTSLARKLISWLRTSNDDSGVCRELLERDHGLRARVVFTGWQSGVEPIIAQSDILVWPGRVSHFARPIMEACSLGVPVLATDWASSREIVDHGVNGLLSPPGDAVLLAANILQLAGAPERRREMGAAGKAFADVHFSAERNSKEIIRIIDLLSTSAVA